MMSDAQTEQLPPAETASLGEMANTGNQSTSEPRNWNEVFSDEPESQTMNSTDSRHPLEPPSSNLERPASASGPIRVPGTYPPEWLPDHEAEACMACESQFTLIKRRHHCRSCGKIFCGDCCRLKARLLYLDNKEARVCNQCHRLIEFTLSETNYNSSGNMNSIQQQEPVASASSSSTNQTYDRVPRTSSVSKVQGVLKTSNNSGQLTRATSNQLSNTSSSSSSDQHINKQVTFSDGIRPGTDLSEQGLSPIASSSGSSEGVTTPTYSLLTRQNRTSVENNTSTSDSNNGKRVRSRYNEVHNNVTVCDEVGFLPPIMISKESPIANGDQTATSSTNQLANLVISQFKSTLGRKSIQASMESRSSPLNGVVKFEDIASLLGVQNVITFLLLKDFYLKAKLITKDCCMDKKTKTKSNEQQQYSNIVQLDQDSLGSDLETEIKQATSLGSNDGSVIGGATNGSRKFWCFTSSGLDKFGQSEIVLVIDKDPEDACIPRDIFKIYLTLHELALRRQALENLGNLLFQDGLFGSRDTAGLVFVRPLKCHCVKNLILPENNKSFLVALVLQRWEVPWSKVFPMRLLLRLGHKYHIYPYPITSYRIREPVYYEVGHTIISILGDFRNFRYSITHVDGLRVMINKATRKVTVQLSQSNYQQFNKVLDSSNNEHVLAWSSCPFPEADGHLVSVQTDDGQYETVEFFKEPKTNESIDFRGLEDSSPVIGASFIIFSGALKVNQSGQPAKISIVEDGLLIQIQSCTMTALKNAIHYMHHFDIDCGKYHHFISDFLVALTLY